MKNLWVQTKNSEENFTNRLDQVEERVSALKTKKGWITQLKKVSNPLQAPRTEHAGTRSMKRQTYRTISIEGEENISNKIIE